MLLCSILLVEKGFELQRHTENNDIMDIVKPTLVNQKVECIIILTN